MRPTFAVDCDAVSLAVTRDGDAVTAIRLHGSAPRGAETPFERAVARELREYFAGTRTTFGIAVRTAGSAFQRAVWDELRRIPYGETRSYADVARAIGHPSAARAVGAANGANPVPIVIPCHRVVRSGGKLGGYGGGLELKRWLLNLETRL